MCFAIFLTASTWMCVRMSLCDRLRQLFGQFIYMHLIASVLCLFWWRLSVGGCVLFLCLCSFFIPFVRWCYCCCCHTRRRLNGAPLETHSNRLTIIFIRITVAAAAISRWLVSFLPFHYSADIARYLYVDILCLIEFRPDLNNEKTTRWNRNGKRDKGRSSASIAAASYIFL